MGTTLSQIYIYLLQYLMRLNRLGVTLCSTSKLKLLERCEQESESRMVSHLQKVPFIKLTGDNFDQYVRASQQTSERQHQDRHWFSTILTFCRIPVQHLPSEIKKVDPGFITPEMFLLTGLEERRRMLNGYKVHFYLSSINPFHTGYYFCSM